MNAWRFPDIEQKAFNAGAAILAIEPSITCNYAT